MERIKLTKAEKQVLRELHRGNNNIPDGIDNYTFVDAVLSLTDKRLIKSAVNGDKVMDCKLTAKATPTYAAIHTYTTLLIGVLLLPLHPSPPQLQQHLRYS